MISNDICKQNILFNMSFKQKKDHNFNNTFGVQTLTTNTTNKRYNKQDTLETNFYPLI